MTELKTFCNEEIAVLHKSCGKIMQMTKISKLDTVNNILINNREFTTYGAIEDAQNFQPAKNYLFPLNYLNTVHVKGDNARQYLQGQVSCDVQAIDQCTMRPGLLCNLKGRIMATMDIFDWQGLHIVLPKDIEPPIIASLNKTALFSRVTFETQNQLGCYGLYLQDKNDILPMEDASIPQENYGAISNKQAILYRITQQLYLIITNETYGAQLENIFLKAQQLKGSLDWHYLALSSKRFQIYPCSQGLFLPQRLELHDEIHVNFKKGCYKGQEIIARMHYRAKNKHSLNLFKISTSESICSGLKIFSKENNKEIGEIIDFCPLSENGKLVLASMTQTASEFIFVEGMSETTQCLLL